MRAEALKFPEEVEADTDWANPEDMAIPEDLPPPYSWRVCVMPVQPKRVSKGGIHLPVQAQDAEGHLQIIGKVVGLGPLAFRSSKLCASLMDRIRILFGRPVSWAPKIGDWVVYGRYTGQRTEYKNLRLVMMNDDELIAGAGSASGFRIYV